MVFFIIIFFVFIVIMAILIFDVKTPTTTASLPANTDNIDELLAKAKNDMRRAEAIIQAEIVGDETTKGAIITNTYKGALPERRDDGGWLSMFDNLRILKIVGINHRQGIGRYIGRVECALVPEPDNEYDHNAIKIIAEDGHHLGYIQKERTEMVRWMTADEFPYHCTAFIKEHEDEIDGHKFFTGHVYIKLLD